MSEVEVSLSEVQKLALFNDLGKIAGRIKALHRTLVSQPADKSHLSEDDWDFLLQLRPFYQHEATKDAADIIENYLTD